MREPGVRIVKLMDAFEVKEYASSVQRISDPNAVGADVGCTIKEEEKSQTECQNFIKEYMEN